MIGAAERLGIARTGRDLDAAMSANIGERVEIAGIVAGDDDRFVGDPECHVVAGIFELLDPRYRQPILHENALFFARVDLG